TRGRAPIVTIRELTPSPAPSKPVSATRRAHLRRYSYRSRSAGHLRRRERVISPGPDTSRVVRTDASDGFTAVSLLHAESGRSTPDARHGAPSATARELNARAYRRWGSRGRHAISRGTPSRSAPQSAHGSPRGPVN